MQVRGGVSVDTGNTNAGCGRYLKEKNPAMQVRGGGEGEVLEKRGHWRYNRRLGQTCLARYCNPRSSSTLLHVPGTALHPPACGRGADCVPVAVLVPKQLLHPCALSPLCAGGGCGSHLVPSAVGQKPSPPPPPCAGGGSGAH